MGAYCASKSALATMSEVWRYELRMWKIKVCTIIPSGYKTGKNMMYYRALSQYLYLHVLICAENLGNFCILI